MSPNPAVPPPVLSVVELRDFLSNAFPGLDRQHQIHEVTDTGVIMRLEVGPQHERPGGTVSGPTMMGLADAGAWMATLSRIGPVALAVTSSLTINFLDKPGLQGELLAHCDLLRLGRRQSVSDVRMVAHPPSEAPRLVAQASVTYSIPRAVNR